MKHALNLGKAEMDVLHHVAEHAPVTVREVADHLAETKGHVRTTVLNTMELWTTNSSVFGVSLPGRVAGWLRKIGFKPELETGAYLSSVSVSDESLASIVRFAHDPQREGYEDINAFLVDERGETIPLIEHRREAVTETSEYVKFWVISPAPVTRERFRLRLRLATEGKDVAIVRLGEL